jgi:peptide-methionine (S)-S-oxide reductase
MAMETGRERAILGGGCFWCLEAAFKRLPGVIAVQNGYAGGDRERPGYAEVCGGLTGHAEVVAIDFDTRIVTYEGILGLFWKIHDPTTEDRQGADIGSQYRSIIFCTSESQRVAALASRKVAQASFAGQIVTEILPAPTFWPAEDYHQNYYDSHPGAGYCRAVIVPKLLKAGFGT